MAAAAQRDRLYLGFNLVASPALIGQLEFQSHDRLIADDAGVPQAFKAAVFHRKGAPMPIQRVEHWEERARKAEEMAAEMDHGANRQMMLEIAALYRELAELAVRAAKFAETKKRER